MFQPYLRNLVLLCSRDAQIVLYGVTVKTTLLDSVPVGVVTFIVPVVAPAGTVVLMAEPEAVNVAAVPLKLTVVVPVRFVPRMVTALPTAPAVGRLFTNGPKPVARLKIVPSLSVPPVVVVP